MPPPTLHRSPARRQLQDLYREMRKLRPDERGSRASDSESDEGGVMGGWRRKRILAMRMMFGGELFFDVSWMKIWVNMTVSD